MFVVKIFCCHLNIVSDHCPLAILVIHMYIVELNIPDLPVY